MAVSSSPLSAHSSNMEIGLVSRYRIKAMSRSREMTGAKIMMSRRFSSLLIGDGLHRQPC
mgnify:CR=1 FL=1